MSLFCEYLQHSLSAIVSLDISQYDKDLMIDSMKDCVDFYISKSKKSVDKDRCISCSCEYIKQELTKLETLREIMDLKTFEIKKLLFNDIGTIQ